MILMATFLDFLHDFVGQLILQLSSGVFNEDNANQLYSRQKL